MAKARTGRRDEGRVLAVSHDGYRFDPHADKWRLSRDVTVRLGYVSELLREPASSSLRQVLEHYATTASAAHANNMAQHFKAFVRCVGRGQSPLAQILPEHLLAYRHELGEERAWYLGALTGLFKLWFRLGIPGIDNGVKPLLAELRLRGNKKGEAVRLCCPHSGPLTDMEYEGLASGVVSAFEDKVLCLAEFVFVLLFLATGRRPSQLGDLKAVDLICASSQEGTCCYVLNIPRRKQRGRPWRGDFKPLALTTDVGEAVSMLVAENRKLVGELFLDCEIPDDLANLIPMFPRWRYLVKRREQGLEALKAQMGTDIFHCETADLGQYLNTIVQTLRVPSERTGQPLRVFPTRLRRTFATRAAREGYGELVIAELLDHSDTQNVRVYVENVPEHVDAINAAIAMQLVPLAQAFAGVLVDRERDAVRGNDLNSRVRTSAGRGVGTCGHYGFCGALAPIACYTCRHFQPWLDGPHREVLDLLQEDKERISALVADSQITTINDRTMVAVAQVIKLCDARNGDLGARRRLG